MPLRQKVVEEMAGLFGVLAHPTRLRIITLLHQGERPVSELKAKLDRPGANVSQHLALLRAHHLVTVRREGTRLYYAIRDARVAQIINCVLDILAEDASHARELRHAIERVRLTD